MPRCYRPRAPVFSVFGLLVCAALAGVETAGGAAPRAPASPRVSDDADRAAVVSIVKDAVSQVRLCGLAIEKSLSADVRSLCRKASADSARTAIAGMQLAQAIGATAATLQPSPDTPAMLDTLAQYSGHEFDRQFLLAQIEKAEDEEHTLRYEVEVTDDVSVRRFETTVLPKIEAHLELAESALRTLSEVTP